MTLIEAATVGDLALVLARIEDGEDVDARDADGLTALHRAAAAGHLEVVRALLTPGPTWTPLRTSRPRSPRPSR